MRWRGRPLAQALTKLDTSSLGLVSTIQRTPGIPHRFCARRSLVVSCLDDGSSVSTKALLLSSSCTLRTAALSLISLYNGRGLAPASRFA
jgi:hypothetical protein